MGDAAAARAALGSLTRARELAGDPEAAERRLQYRRLAADGRARPRLRPGRRAATVLAAAAGAGQARVDGWSPSSSTTLLQSIDDPKQERALRKRFEERGKRTARRAEWDELRLAVDTVGLWHRDRLATAVGAPDTVLDSEPAGDGPETGVAGGAATCSGCPLGRLGRTPVTRAQPSSGARAGGDVSPSQPDLGRSSGERKLMMANVVGVVFQPGGKVYSFDPAGLELRWDEKVICQTARGRELGRVVQPNHESDQEFPTPLKRVVRRADTADEQQARENALEAKRSIRVFRQLARQHNAAAQADLGRDGVRPEPDRVQLRVRGQGRHLARCAPTSSSALHRAHRAAPGRAARSGPAVRRARACAAARCVRAATPATSSRSRCGWRRIRSCP